jgi:transcriptional regulator of acetoin/glycerol metabolism
VLIGCRATAAPKPRHHDLPQNKPFCNVASCSSCAANDREVVLKRNNAALRESPYFSSSPSDDGGAFVWETFGVLILSEPTTASVQERWARAKKLGVVADSEAYPVGTTDSDLLQRRDRLEDAFREEGALIAPISAQLAEAALIAIVADRDGVILSTHADRAFADPAARARLVEGARWGEDARGTNAIGTAIVEGKPVAVVGKAHFERRNHGLFCYATPVRDPYGDIACVLDVSGPMVRHDARVGVAVQAAGIALERALRVIAYGDRHSGALTAVERLVHRVGGPALLIEASGIVRVINAAAKATLPLDGAERITCERMFGVSFAQLCVAAQNRGEMRFETRGGAYRVMLDPIAGAKDRTLAVIVHFEPETTKLPKLARTSSAPPPPPNNPAFDSILGDDEAILRAKGVASRLAKTELPVLLLAETGTGKELFARAVHAASPRASGPFVAVNCGSFSPHLIASELFGYAPGAFTGAARNGSEGRVGAARGGTLFLDEVAEMPDALQAALLRLLDDGVYQRVGESRERKGDFRLICATCRDLPLLVERGTFRRDLFYRVQGAGLTIPALRDRTDRISLARALAAQLSSAHDAPTFSDDAIAWIENHDWPGNVRELKSAIQHAMAMAAGERLLTRDHFPKPMTSRPPAPEKESPKTRDEILRAAIETTLRSCSGNVSEAARRLGVGRGTIYRSLAARRKSS